MKAFTFLPGEVTVEIRFGPQPKYRIAVPQGPEPRVVGDTAPMKLTVYGDASTSPYAGHLLTEIACWTDAKNLPESSKGEELIEIANLVAARVGLCIHPQLLYSLVNQKFLAEASDGKLEYSNSNTFHIVDRVLIDEEAISRFSGPSEFNDRLIHSPALDWLIRAWSERDLVLQFVAFFIPIEIALQGYKAPRIFNEKDERIWQCLRDNGAPDSAVLLSHFEELLKRQPPPSLADRFEAMAREANMEGWENDVQAFRHFNSMRNALLHRGDRSRMKFKVTVKREQVIELRHLTQRYLAWVLFQEPHD